MPEIQFRNQDHSSRMQELREYMATREGTISFVRNAQQQVTGFRVDAHWWSIIKNVFTREETKQQDNAYLDTLLGSLGVAGLSGESIRTSRGMTHQRITAGLVKSFLAPECTQLRVEINRLALVSDVLSSYTGMLAQLDDSAEREQLINSVEAQRLRNQIRDSPLSVSLVKDFQALAKIVGSLQSHLSAIDESEELQRMIVGDTAQLDDWKRIRAMLYGQPQVQVVEDIDLTQFKREVVGGNSGISQPLASSVDTVHSHASIYNREQVSFSMEEVDVGKLSDIDSGSAPAQTDVRDSEQSDDTSPTLKYFSTYNAETMTHALQRIKVGLELQEFAAMLINPQTSHDDDALQDAWVRSVAAYTQLCRGRGVVAVIQECLFWTQNARVAAEARMSTGQGQLDLEPVLNALKRVVVRVHSTSRLTERQNEYHYRADNYLHMLLTGLFSANLSEGKDRSADTDTSSDDQTVQQMTTRLFATNSDSQDNQSEMLLRLTTQTEKWQHYEQASDGRNMN